MAIVTMVMRTLAAGFAAVNYKEEVTLLPDDGAHSAVPSRRHGWHFV